MRSFSSRWRSARTRLRALGVPPRRVNEIVLGKRGITADTAIWLAKHFGTSEQFWMGLQADYDLEEARKGMKRAA